MNQANQPAKLDKQIGSSTVAIVEPVQENNQKREKPAAPGLEKSVEIAINGKQSEQASQR